MLWKVVYLFLFVCLSSDWLLPVTNRHGGSDPNGSDSEATWMAPLGSTSSRQNQLHFLQVSDQPEHYDHRSQHWFTSVGGVCQTGSRADQMLFWCRQLVLMFWLRLYLTVYLPAGDRITVVPSRPSRPVSGERTNSLVLMGLIVSGAFILTVSDKKKTSSC